jgi:sulfite reductase (NADPH) flavoprotein alpha-component
MSNAASAIVPLAENRRELLARLVEGLDATALNWLSGYAAGLAARAGEPAPAPNVTAAALQRLTVLYGSQTGNARRQAERLAHDAQAAGLAVRLLRADAYPARELANERLLAVVISTQGDGDPPDDARGFVEFLSSRRAPKLPELRFTVLGLGDSSYPKFCSVGRAIDARLAELGATRLADRADADVDIESVANPWQERTLAEVREALKAQVPLATVTPLRPHVAVVTTWSRDKPFAATVLANQRITGRDSARDVRHIELSLEGSGPGYEPGDALGVWPRNPPALVDAVLDALNLDGDGLV